MAITDPRVDAYLAQLVPSRDQAHAAVERETRERNVPSIGPYEGHLLAWLVELAGARRVLELGAASGYSAIWLGKAVVGRGGSVTTVDRDPRKVAEARENLRRCGLSETVTVVEGDGLAYLQMQADEYDVIFLDIVSYIAQEEEIDRLIDACLPRLCVGGILMADNALRQGDVAMTPVPTHARGMHRYNQRIVQDARLDSIVLPIRDGLALTRKR